MQYVSELWESLASHYRLPSRMAILDSIRADCILATWLVPTKLTLELIQKSHAHPDFFRERHVLWAAVDDQRFYNSKEEPVNMHSGMSLLHVTIFTGPTPSLALFPGPIQKKNRMGPGNEATLHQRYVTHLSHLLRIVSCAYTP